MSFPGNKKRFCSFRKMRKKTYKQMREEGLCTSCGKTNPTPEYNMCPSCRERKSATRRENAGYKKRIGICVDCGKEEAEPGKNLCWKCEEKKSQTDKNRRQKHLENLRLNDLDRYYRLKEQGICVYCRKRPSVPGKTKCSFCLSKIRNRRNERRTNLNRSEWVSFGICYTCGKNKVIPGHGVCEDCYKIRMQAISKCLENCPEGFNEYWKGENSLAFRKMSSEKRNDNHITVP